MNIKAIGIANKSSNGDILDVFYPNIEFGNKKINNEIKNINSNDKEIIIECTQEDLNRPIENVQEAYLKLHLLSYKLVLPNSINLDGLFNFLPFVFVEGEGGGERLEKGEEDTFLTTRREFSCLTKKSRKSSTFRIRA